MNFTDLISHFGTQERVAAALGINQSSVAGWKRNGIPLPRQFQIEVISGAALKADREHVEAERQ